MVEGLGLLRRFKILEEVTLKDSIMDTRHKARSTSAVWLLLGLPYGVVQGFYVDGSFRK